MKTGLNKTNRELLRNHVETNIVPTKEIAKEEKFYQSMYSMLEKMHQQAFPEKDMLVVKKYLPLEEHNKFRVYVENKESDSINPIVVEIKSDDSLKSPGHSVWRYTPDIGTVTNKSNFFRAYEKWQKQVEVTQEARNKINTDMFSLIDNSCNFEDVVEVWAGAEVLRNRICGKMQISTLDESTIERIKAITKTK